MTGDREHSIRFILNGVQHELARATVDDRLSDVSPETVRKHAVRVNDTWFPVVQAFEAATGVPRVAFISHTARRHLASLGYEVRGEIDTRTSVPGGQKQMSPLTPVDESWHTEAGIQAAVVGRLVGLGWHIVSVANTATKERGIDVIAENEGETVGVEVKGYPSRGYADPARAGETKPTSPSTQAVHWYSQAALAAMRLRGKRPETRSVIALPDFPRYRNLYAETRTSLDAAGITIWWVDSSNNVVESGPRIIESGLNQSEG